MFYLVTGIDKRGKRFRLQYSCKKTALSINLWQGNVWQVDDLGKRKRIKAVIN